MRKNLTLLVAGLAVAGMAGTPAAAQAAVTTPKAAALPALTSVGCGTIQQYQTGKYATEVPDGLWLWFESQSQNTPTRYCFLKETGETGWYEIQDENTSSCLSLNTSAIDPGSGDPEIGQESCSYNYSWEQWGDTPTTLLGGTYAFENGYESYCLYDNTQEPAIAAPCNDPTVNPPTDKFMWFTLWASSGGNITLD